LATASGLMMESVRSIAMMVVFPNESVNADKK
jgi:hypothetical protein